MTLEHTYVHVLKPFLCRNYALAACTVWLDVDGPALAIGSLNHYDIVKWIVKPLSEGKQCSFVELVATYAQPAEYYVTHYFGQPVRDMLECLQHQLRTRHLGDDTLFWMWAYARQPHQSFVPDVLHSSDAFQAARIESDDIIIYTNTTVYHISGDFVWGFAGIFRIWFHLFLCIYSMCSAKS